MVEGLLFFLIITSCSRKSIFPFHKSTKKLKEEKLRLCRVMFKKEFYIGYIFIFLLLLYIYLFIFVMLSFFVLFCFGCFGGFFVGFLFLFFV